MSQHETQPPVDVRSTGWRLARTLLMVLVISWLGCVAHVMGGGRIEVSGLSLALSLPLISGIFALTRFRLGPLGCLPVLAAGQFAVHGLLMIGAQGAVHSSSILAGAPVGPSAASGMAHMHGHHAAVDMDATHTMAGGMDGMSMDHGSMPMLVAHILGTLLAMAVLGSVDATLWVLSALVLPWLRRVCLRAIQSRPRMPLADAVEALPPRTSPPRASDPVRGPPEFLTFS